jgi:hypothetical protein
MIKTWLFAMFGRLLSIIQVNRCFCVDQKVMGVMFIFTEWLCADAQLIRSIA